MKFFLSVLWVVLTGCLFYFGHDHYLCEIRGLCDDNNGNVETLIVKEEAELNSLTPNFLIKDEGKSVFAFNGSPIFMKGADAIVFPDSLGSINDSIYSYLDLSPKKDVHVTMYYEPSLIKENGLSDSLITSKKLETFVSNLIKNGVNKDKIVQSLKPREEMYASETVYDGLEISFESISDELMAKIDEGISNKTLYSAFGKGDFKADRTLAGYASELKDYLGRYPDKKVTVTGHTDNVGDTAPNYRLGLKRANNVSNYLISRGVDSSRIKAISKGETEPVNPADTEEARSLNRRIEVIVK